MTHSSAPFASRLPSRLTGLASAGFARAIEAMNGLGTAWIIALMLLINADVLGRALFNHPIAGVPEMVSLSIVGIVFLQLAHTARTGRITRSTALLDLLERRAPRLRTAIEALSGLCGCIVVGAMAHAAAPLFLQAWSEDEYIGEMGNLTVPLWPIRLIILVGCLALITQFLITTTAALAELRRPRGTGAVSGEGVEP